MFQTLINRLRGTRTTAEATANASRATCACEPLEGRALFAAAPPGDLNGDGNVDIIFRNYQTGQNSVWLMNRTQVTQQLLLNPVGNLAWNLVGSADFDKNGNSDLVWFNNQNKIISIWYQGGANGTQTLSNPALGTFNVPDVVAAGVGDINNDGNPDIMFRNTIQDNGRNYFLLMGGFMGGQGLGLTETIPVGNNAWSVTGLGDFNADGKTDIAWHNNANNNNSIWFMNGPGTRLSNPLVTPGPTDPNVFGLPQAAGDFNGDGRADLVFRNYSVGQPNFGRNQIWIMNAADRANLLDIASNTNPSWQIAGGQVV